MIRPKHETKDLLLSFTKNCETVIHQYHTKPKETLELKLIKPRETFHFNPAILFDGSWMIGLTSLEVYKPHFNITEQKNKFEHYKFPDSKIGGIPYEEVRDEIEKDLEISDIIATDLQDDIIGPNFIDEKREQVTKRMKNDESMRLLAVCNSSVFQDFESFLRTENNLVKDDIRLVLDENKSVYHLKIRTRFLHFRRSFRGSSKIFQPEYEGYHVAIDIVFDDVTMKLELVVGPSIIAIRFDRKSCFSNVFGFKPNWDYKISNKTLAKKL